MLKVLASDPVESFWGGELAVKPKKVPLYLFHRARKADGLLKKVSRAWRVRKSLINLK